MGVFNDSFIEEKVEGLLRALSKFREGSLTSPSETLRSGPASV